MLAILAVARTNAQQVSVVNNPSENLAVNTKTSTIVHVSTNTDREIQQGGDAERSKSFSKSFNVDNGDKVSFNNQYGSIVIKTWDKKEVKVDVDIKAYSNSDSDAQKLIDAISIEAGKSGDAVSFKTNMNDNDNFMGRIVRNGVSKRREVKINYTVFMPATNALTVMQQYGNVELGNYAGPTSLKVQYGNLNAGNLSNVNNYINVQYGKTTIQDLNAATVKHEYGAGINIGSVGSLELVAEYVAANINVIRKSADIKVEYGSGLTVGSIGGNLLLNTEYAKVNINSIKGNTVIKQGYGSLAIASVAKLSLKTEYTNVTLGSLNGDANIDMDYNRLSVSELTSACRNFTFNGEYTSVGLGFGEGYSGNFNVSTTYAGFKYGGNVSSRMVSNDDENKKYSGKIGNGGSGNINIKTEYGAVTFK